VVAISKEKAALKEQLDGRVAIENDIARNKANAGIYMNQAKELKAAPNPHAASITKTTERLATLKTSLAALTVHLADFAAAKSLHEASVRVFGPAGVRAHILDTVTPFLNERTADYLSALSDGNITAVWATLAETAKGELREKFNIEVSNDKGAESFAGLSGGEKRKVRIATMLALQDLVASRASNPIDIYFGDEIDDALDSHGLERLMGILERKAREKGTVLIISHNSLTDWCDQVVRVVKKGGVSTITGALSA
jgi:DNA repair exonuclease SbcCD ATPase subunit